MKIADCPEPPKVDPRVRRTRKLIEDAFRALLVERPYADISVGDVVDRATVHRATFYAHFQNKEHLATSLIGGDLESALRARLTHGLPLNHETLGEVAEAIFSFFGHIAAQCDDMPGDTDPDTPGSYDSALAPTLMTTLQKTIHSLLRRWLDLDPEAMRAFPGTRKDDTATVLAWSLYGGALSWSRTKGRRAPAGEAARRIVSLLIR